MGRFTVVVLLALAVLAPARLRAQEDALSSGFAAMGDSMGTLTMSHSRATLLPTSGPVDAHEYLLGPGDGLLLEFSGRLSRATELFVDAEGGLKLPGIATLMVAGRTLEDVRAEVVRRAMGQLKGVSVELRLVRPRQFQVFLAGRLAQTGPAVAQATSRVSDVVSPAMILPDGSHRRIEVVSRNGTVRYADLEWLLRTGSHAHDPFLRDGDVVRVPIAREFASVQGAVASPGRMELGDHDSLSVLLRLAGGLLPSAAPQSAKVVHWRNAHEADSLLVDLREVIAGRADLPIENEEHVYVYYQPQFRQQREATIVGEVLRPGTYPIVEGRTRLSDLVANATGFTSLADLSTIRVHRRNPNAGSKDAELERLLRLSRGELTASEYENMRTKLAEFREDYQVDWALLQRHPNELDLLLRDADFVRVERLVSSVRVDGEVAHPGILGYRDGLTAADYVAAAGGFTNRAWPGKMRVKRAVSGQTLLARDVRALDPGDFLWVPERPDRTIFEQSRDLLTVLGSVATIVIAIRSLR